MNKRLFTGILFLISYLSNAQECKIPVADTSVFINEVNGVVSYGNGTIKIEYILPLEEISQINKKLEVLSKITNDLEIIKKDLKDQKVFNHFVKEQLEKVVLELNTDNNSLTQKDHSSESNESVEKAYQVKFDAKIAEYRRLTEFDTIRRNSHPLIELKMKELTFRAENIILNRDCLAEIPVKELKNIETGQVYYGYLLEDIQNKPGFVLLNQYSNGFARVV